MSQLFFDAVHLIAARHYASEQIAAWAPATPDPARIAGWGSDGRLFLVAVNAADVPLAFADLERDGHLDHLFCRPDVAGTGIAARLYREIEAAAGAQGLDRIFTEASESARRFFERQGFVLLYRRDFELSGVPIHNYAMEKRIPSPARP